MTKASVIVGLNGLLAVAIQHEIDHLSGILYTDRIENLRDIYKVEFIDMEHPILANNTTMVRDPKPLKNNPWPGAPSE